MTHNNPSPGPRTACAPYNFVPLPERIIKAVDSAHELPDHNRFTNANYPNSGYIEVELKTESPLYIRSPLTRAEKRRDQRDNYRDADVAIDRKTRDYYQRLAKNKPDFFHIDPKSKEPVIPGSSLRGMIRNIFEIITYSPPGPVQDKRLIYRDVAGNSSLANFYREQFLGPNQSDGHQRKFEYPGSWVQGGYLVQLNDGAWGIQPARCDPSTFGETIVHVECPPTNPPTVEPVSVSPASRSWTRRHGGNLHLNIVYCNSRSGHGRPAPDLPAWLVKTWQVGHNKHMQCAVYEPDWSKEPIPIPDDLERLYKEDSEISRGNLPTRDLFREFRTAAHKDERNRAIVPLFYRVNPSKQLVYFGSTLMFRMAYDRNTAQCGLSPQRRTSVIGFADAVFGFVQSNSTAQGSVLRKGIKGDAYSSRVRFTDALLESGQRDVSMRAFTPKILASPKPSCFQHYLEQDRPNDAQTLVHYDDPDQPMLRGSKQFWHQNRQWYDIRVAQQVVENENTGLGDTQKTYLQPIRGGKAEHGNDDRPTFTFRISFHSLSNTELGGLLWAISPVGSNNRQTYCHKLGMAKPYGLGSVSLAMSKCVLVDRTARYDRLLTEDDSWQTGTVECSAEQIHIKKAEFEREILRKLELPPTAQLAQIRRIGMLLKIMEWPGQTATSLVDAVPAGQQIRNKNIRYMSININGTGDRNEYKNRPVLPDVGHWMTEQEKEFAFLIPLPAPESALPTEITIGDPEKPFNRFQVGDVIKLSAKQERVTKKGIEKLKTIYRAADDAQAIFEGDVPEVVDDLCLGKVKAINTELSRYTMKKI